jgi:hypothetical protein
LKAADAMIMPGLSLNVNGKGELLVPMLVVLFVLFSEENLTSRRQVALKEEPKNGVLQRHRRVDLQL